MPERILDIHALTPLLLRDGRPFGATGDEARARSLPSPLPGTLAGFVRTQVGMAAGWNWHSHDTLKAAHDIPVCSSLLFRDGVPMLPAPRNAVMDKAGKLWRTAPQKLQTGEGCELPEGLQPLGFVGEPPDDNFKPEPGCVYWPKDALTQWLLNQSVSGLEKISGPPLDERTHVAINPQTGTADEGQLFSVSCRSFEERQKESGQSDSVIPRYQRHIWSLRLRATLPDTAPDRSLGHLGGERRPASLRVVEDTAEHWFRMPQALKDALLDEKNTRLCMVLTTPALFDDGWKPGWLSRDAGPQLPAGISAIRPYLKLLGAATGRREPVSGWNLRENRPKAVRWMVPAGSVYFFEVQEGAPANARAKLLEAWLRPVSDRQADQKDGYGAAAWGIWK